jgi:small subunit ribosomal protein S6
MSRLYETMYILRPDLSDSDVDNAIAKYQTILQNQGAESITIQHRGRRRLAYDIAGHREGTYIQMNYEAPSRAIEDLEKAMRLSEEVIRYLTTKRKPEELDRNIVIPAVEEVAASNNSAPVAVAE